MSEYYKRENSCIFKTPLDDDASEVRYVIDGDHFKVISLFNIDICESRSFNKSAFESLHRLSMRGGRPFYTGSKACVWISPSPKNIFGSFGRDLNYWIFFLISSGWIGPIEIIQSGSPGHEAWGLVFIWKGKVNNLTTDKHRKLNELIVKEEQEIKKISNGSHRGCEDLASVHHLLENLTPTGFDELRSIVVDARTSPKSEFASACARRGLYSLSFCSKASDFPLAKQKLAQMDLPGIQLELPAR